MGLPRAVHIWDVDGFVKLSDKARSEFKKLIKKHGVRRLSRVLKFDRETIDSIYRKGRKKGAHSVKCLLKIANFLSYDFCTLEREVTHYGTIQTDMYKILFPFLLTPLHLRAVTIHGDGSFYRSKTSKSIQAEWYQLGSGIMYMQNLLNNIIKDNPIKYKIKNKENNVYSISIPSHLVRLVCVSLNLKLEQFHSIEFFKTVANLPAEYSIQVFFQFIFDEGHLKGTTLTVSQRKKWSREGFKILLDSLGFEYSNPLNDNHDITIYNYNFYKILDILNKSKEKFGDIAGLWFKEEKFLEACKKVKVGVRPHSKMFRRYPANTT